MDKNEIVNKLEKIHEMSEFLIQNDNVKKDRKKIKKMIKHIKEDDYEE